jgi:N-methylhydantoinase A
MSGAAEGKSTQELPEAWSGLPVVAVDTGGTFTDLLLLREGGLTALKLPSTPEDPSESVLEGIRQLLGPPESRPPFLLIHGSTVATNAVLERKGARVVLVTNRGFEDVVEIGRQDRPQLYALVGHRPPPPVAREDRVGIGGRLGPDGTELAPLDPEELRDLPGRVAAGDAVAVSLLHSYADPSHEEAVGKALEGLDVPVALSSSILPEFREYERTSTTVMNAYVAPKMTRYLRRIERESGAAAVRIMGSAGGALPLGQALAEPVRTVLSGPAGGVTGALIRGSRHDRSSLLTFDMGGTSTDVSLIPERLLHTREGMVGGLPVAIPMVDIHTVGAGGGSIARLDPGGALLVGPESAGADPGPICYGKGGEEVTVTDAHVWLGRLPVSAFLGGARRLDREGIRKPLETLAERMQMAPEEAAEGIIQVANATMERALRVISVERGVDPSELHLMAFGGAAGLHAAELATRLGARGILVPPDPGLASAWGMLAAPVVRDRTRTVLLRSDAPEEAARLRSALDEMEAEARREMEAEGLPPDRLRSRREVDARYLGQSWELTVPEADWTAAFHRAHLERYGYRREAQPVEAVTLRLRVEAPGVEAPAQATRSGAAGQEAPMGSAGAGHGVPPGPREEGGSHPPSTVSVRDGGQEVKAFLLPRSSVGAVGWTEGPAILVEYSATTWCPRGWKVRAMDGGMLELLPSSPPSGPP